MLFKTKICRAASGQALLLVFLLFFRPLPVCGLADIPEADEYDLKAAMVANVIRLVDWPAPKNADAPGGLTVCVVNSEEMGAALGRVAARSPAAGRHVTVKAVSGVAGPDNKLEQCQVIFLGGSDKKRIELVLQAVGTQPVLTLGESDRFMSSGGMVCLRVKDDRIEVEVNLGVAQSAGLTISSRLLRIAVMRSGGA